MKIYNVLIKNIAYDDAHDISDEERFEAYVISFSELEKAKECLRKHYDNAKSCIIENDGECDMDDYFSDTYYRIEQYDEFIEIGNIYESILE